MASETPPTYNTTIFNQANFNTSTSSDAIDYAYLAGHYLKYPISQTGATETIYDMIVSNDLTVGGTNGLTIDGGASNTKTVFGYNTNTSTASNTTALGINSLTTNTTGTNNTAVGHNALTLANSSNNTACGYNTLDHLTSGIKNTAVGNNALTALTTGSGNIGVGRQAGQLITTGSNNIFLGYQANSSSATNLSDSIAIGYNAKITASNQIVLGVDGIDCYVPQLYPQYTSTPTSLSYLGGRETVIPYTWVCGTGTATVGTLSVPAGSYLITAYASFDMGATTTFGSQFLSISTTNNTINYDYVSSRLANTIGSVDGSVVVQGLISFTSTTTVYIVAKGSSTTTFVDGDDADKGVVSFVRIG